MSPRRCATRATFSSTPSATISASISLKSTQGCSASARAPASRYTRRPVICQAARTTMTMQVPNGSSAIRFRRLSARPTAFLHRCSLLNTAPPLRITASATRHPFSRRSAATTTPRRSCSAQARCSAPSTPSSITGMPCMRVCSLLQSTPRARHMRPSMITALLPSPVRPALHRRAKTSQTTVSSSALHLWMIRR